MQWSDGRSKHTRQWLDCGNSIPRYVFPISKTCSPLFGGPKTSRDWKKDCGEPGYPNDNRSQCSPVATRIELLPLMCRVLDAGMTNPAPRFRGLAPKRPHARY